jgi:hypothetical protein
MKLSRWIVLACCAPALAACPRIYSVGTGVRSVQAVPDSECVSGVLRATPGVTDVNYSTRADRSFYLFPYIGNVAENYYHWSYRAGDRTLWLMIQKVRNSISFHNNLISGASFGPDRVRLQSVMERIDARLVAECGLTPA